MGAESIKQEPHSNGTNHKAVSTAISSQGSVDGKRQRKLLDQLVACKQV